MTWNETINDLTLCGFLADPVELGQNVYAATPTQGWRAAARELAGRLPGQILPGAGCSWRMGARTDGVLIDHRNRTRIDAARDIQREVMGADNLAWSVGGVARRMLAWAATPQPYPREQERGHAERLYEPGEDIGYHSCAPGWYEEAELWDVSACYATLLRRLPSLRVTVTPQKRLLWHRMGAEERDRWQEVLSAVWDHKTLRNALWGTCLGSYKRQYAYANDGPGACRIIRPVFGPGPFRPAALVVARTAKELCAEESCNISSIYGTIDSVMSPAYNRLPAVWRRVGLECSVKHRGKAHVCARGTWAFWGESSGALLHATIPYQRGSREAIAIERSVVTPTIYPQWL